MSAVATATIPQRLRAKAPSGSSDVGPSGVSKRSDDVQHDPAITEEHFDLTVDFDSEVEESLGPDFWQESRDDPDYDKESMNMLDRDYTDEPEDFKEYFERAKSAWNHDEKSEMKNFLWHNGIEMFLKEYVVVRREPVQDLLFAFGVLLSKERRKLDDLSLLPLLKAALFRSMRRRPIAPRVAKANKTLDDILQHIREANKIIVLTGAGISVSCGIPDFRSRDGLYSQLFSSGVYDLDDPQQLFDINYFKHNPSVFYSFAHKIYPSNFTPSFCHYFIKAIEDKGKLLRNYTQNIDTLESKAGIERVLRCHGSFATASCINCHVKVPGDTIKDDLLAQRVPLCKVCNPEVDLKPKKVRRKKKKRKRNDGWESDEPEEIVPPLPAGIMKPDITFFGEKLSNTFDKKLFKDIKSADLLLVIGTSLKVRPVSEIISHLPHSIPILVINKTPLTHINPSFQLLGDADGIVKYLANKLGWGLLQKDIQSSRAHSKELYGQGRTKMRILGDSGVVLFEGAEGGKFVDKLIASKSVLDLQDYTYYRHSGLSCASEGKARWEMRHLEGRHEMPSTDTYDASLTSVEFPWPKGVTAIERIMLSAHGDLQRILSAFFARPIVITPIFVKTTPFLDSSALAPSPASPTTQKRQVHLVCADRTVCIATSSVTITSARCAELFLKDGYAIGQIFRKMGVVPAFELLEAGLVGESDEARGVDEKSTDSVKHEKRKLWRRYTLKTEGFAADIIEVFPDRDVFTRGEDWLAEPQFLAVPNEDTDVSGTPSLSPTETLVHFDEIFESSVSPCAEPAKDTWSDSSNGLLRFMAVFIAVLLLLNVPKEGDPTGSHIGDALFGRIARLLNVQGVSDD